MAHLNSAEGIPNIGATQIMTKSKSLRRVSAH